VVGHPVRAVSRTNPSAPYPGGVPIRWDWWWSGYDCTAAFGVRDSQGEYLLTAEHCFDPGDVIEDMNGDRVGGVRREDLTTDSALVFAGDSQAGVWVNDSLVLDVASTALSWNGELACQSGYTLRTRCDIEVVNEYVRWDFDGRGYRYGVEGRRCAGCDAVDHGDSGGPVWSVNADLSVVARGIVSAGHTPLQDGGPYEFILWTEVPAAENLLGFTTITS
jgi:hypothetical protein